MEPRRSGWADSLPARDNFLDFREITKAFGGQRVLDRISGEIAAGEVILLRGANGSGKTTLLNILSGNVEPDSGEIRSVFARSERIFRFPRKWWSSLLSPAFSPELFASRGTGRTWQEVRLFSSHTLLDNIAVATPNQAGEKPQWALLSALGPQGLSSVAALRKEEADNRAMAHKRLAVLGLADRHSSSADKISLGQAKRVAISRAVQAGARLLLLDEPLAGLDEAGKQEVLRLLRALAVEQRVSLIVVEHFFNVPRILEFATKVWTLVGGRLTIETLTQSDKNSRGYTPRIAHVTDTNSLGNLRPRDEPLPKGAVLRRLRSASVSDSPPVLAVRDLVVSRGKRVVLGEPQRDGTVRGLSFEVRSGELVRLLAPNGWGKTTLFEAIAGLVSITNGSIELNGRSIVSLPPWERTALGLGLLRARDNSFPNLSVHEVLRLTRVEDAEDYLGSLLAKQMSNLSGGERQRVALVCALRLGSGLLLLDEPFSSLDDQGIEQTWAKILAAPGSGLIAEPLELGGHR